jgi:hypothetical protein
MIFCVLFSWGSLAVYRRNSWKYTKLINRRDQRRLVKKKRINRDEWGLCDSLWLGQHKDRNEWQHRAAFEAVYGILGKRKAGAAVDDSFDRGLQEIWEDESPVRLGLWTVSALALWGVWLFSWRGKRVFRSVSVAYRAVIQSQDWGDLDWLWGVGRC